MTLSYFLQEVKRLDEDRKQRKIQAEEEKIIREEKKFQLLAEANKYEFLKDYKKNLNHIRKRQKNFDNMIDLIEEDVE